MSQDPANSRSGRDARVDPAIFLTAAILLLAAALPILAWPEQAGPAIIRTYDWIAGNLGLAYQWGMILAVVLLLRIALGPLGRVRLGNGDEPTEFGRFAWVSMLFCAGVGAGLIYWATIEWSHYYDHPPMGAAPGGEEARMLATSYGLFHWGPLAWLIYALPTVAISYQFYVRRAPSLRLSTGVHGLLGEGRAARTLHRVIDGVFVVSLLAGAGTSIGLSVPMISASIADSFGLTRGIGLDASVVGACVVMLAAAAWTGLHSGIARLATWNVTMAFVFLAYVLFTGPTQFILRQGTESIGYALQNSLRMMTYTDAVLRTGFVENWTIFYWAWWFAYGPIVGIFVTRISRGRTLRELILGMAVFGSLGAWTFFVVLGNYAFWLDLHGIVAVRTIVQEQGTAPAISAVMGSLPAGGIARIVFAGIAMIFIAATYNSKAYALAASSTRALSVGDDPGRANRVFWALALGLLPIALMSVQGGIKIAMACVLVASLPLLCISAAMAWNFLRSVRAAPGGL